MNVYFCPIEGCGKRFPKKCNLVDHMRKHTGERPYGCPHCEWQFTQAGNLRKHMMVKHGVIPFLSNFNRPSAQKVKKYDQNKKPVPAFSAEDQK